MHRSVAAVACAAALAACVACNRSNNGNSALGTAQKQGDHTTADMGSTREPAGPKNQAVTYEGCLQEGGGTVRRGYLLTMVNEPSTVGTAGSVTRSGSSVEREQLREAASTYRLDPKDDVKLGDMVGKRVRITGTIEEAANLPNGKDGIGSDRDTQLPNRDRNQQDNGTNLNVTDLGKIEVSNATVVANACGASNTGNSGRTVSGGGNPSLPAPTGTPATKEPTPRSHR